MPDQPPAEAPSATWSWWTAMPQWQQIAVVLVATFAVIWVVRRFIVGRLEKVVASTENDFDDRMLQLFKQFFTLIALFAAVLIIVKICGGRISALLAGAGIAGIAIGLAAKETLADVLAGIFLITDRPMRIGDRVKIERIGREWGGWGDVLDMGIRRTQVRNTDGVVVNYPNNVLANSVITNFSLLDQPIRVRVRFQLAYEADLEKAAAVAEGAIGRTEGVLEGTSQVVVRSAWDTAQGHLLAGILMEGRYRITDVRDRTRIRSAVLKNLIHDLRAEEIPLAVPQVRLEAAPEGRDVP